MQKLHACQTYYNFIMETQCLFQWLTYQTQNGMILIAMWIEGESGILRGVQGWGWNGIGKCYCYKIYDPPQQIEAPTPQLKLTYQIKLGALVF